MSLFSRLFGRIFSFFKALPVAYRIASLVVLVGVALLVSLGSNDTVTVTGKQSINLPLNLDTATDEEPDSTVAQNEAPAANEDEIPEDEQRMWSYQIQPGDTLTGIFNRLNLPLRDLYQVMEADESILALDNIKPGVKLLVDIENSQLQSLELRFSIAHSVIFERKSDLGFEYKEVKLPGQWKTYTLRGIVESSFGQAAIHAGVDTRDAYQIVHLLKEKINFRRDLRKGDKFQVLLSRQFVKGKPTGETRVDAIRLQAKRTPVAIFYYDGSYYDAQGRSLSHAFLRYPFHGHYRISSPFNPHRLHPVTGLVSPHYGTDFATPTGTSVYVTGDGVVERVVHHKYAGLYITVRHSPRYVTRYLHLSKALVHVGQRVVRGQKIALSGSSGRVTGPHLHYEVRIAGHPTNPVTAPLPIAKELKGKDKIKFKETLKQYLARLNDNSDNGVMLSASDSKKADDKSAM